MFKAFRNDIAGSSIVPFLLYLAARKYDWRLTLFGEILFGRFTQFAITILKDILKHISDSQVNGLLYSVRTLDIEDTNTFADF